MEKKLLDIKEIRVSKSSMDGYGLDVFLKSGLQMKSKFHDEKQYAEAVAANGNLTELKDIFRQWIDNVLKQNPEYEYVFSNCELYFELLGHIMENPDDNMYQDAMDVLRTCADEKEIEFDGYFKERWKDSADTIVNFDEEYFDDPDKTELYVFLSALADDEIYNLLHYTYNALFAEKISKDFVQEKIDYLTKEKGVRF